MAALQEWQAQQDKVKSEPLMIVYSYWDGSGHRREIKVKKGDTVRQGWLTHARAVCPQHYDYVYPRVPTRLLCASNAAVFRQIGQFLKAVREQLLPDFRELRHVSVDNLIYVKVGSHIKAALLLP